jgi:uncharacterized membrane protein YsdA (DUF1294 family)
MSEDELSQQHAMRLEAPERTLLLLRDELYGGSWEELVADLEARHKSKPFVYKLSSRIEEDLQRIARMRAYETQQGTDLATLLPEAEEKP